MDTPGDVAERIRAMFRKVLDHGPRADELLGRSPLAALVGMLLDQQIPMEWAFSGPYTIARRLGSDDLDAYEIAACAPERFAALLSASPPCTATRVPWPSGCSSSASTLRITMTATRPRYGGTPAPVGNSSSG